MSPRPYFREGVAGYDPAVTSWGYGGRVLHCSSFWVAARYAAAKNWALRDWCWQGGENAPEECEELD